MKVLLFVSQDISRRLVESFSRRKGVELAVATQTTPRDRIYGYASAVDFCAEKGIPCWQPRKIDAEFVARAKEFAPDIVVAAYFPQIFPKELLAIPRLGAFNVHPGDLPRYRGTFAIPWTILNGEKEVVATLHHIDAGVDSGDIVAQKRSPVGPEETGFELYKRAMHLCADLLEESFDALASGKAPRRPQTGHGSYYNRLEPRCRIDWAQPRETIKRQVRVHAKPYLPAHAYLVNRCLYIDKVSYADEAGSSAVGAGKIVRIYPDKTFAVSCADGWLKVDRYEAYPALNEEEFRLHFVEGARLD